MKRLIIILSAFFIALCGCGVKADESGNSLSAESDMLSVTSFSPSATETSMTASNESSENNISSFVEINSNSNKSPEGESSFWTNINGTFIDYVGGREFDEFVKEVENAKEPNGEKFFIMFCKRFSLTREEILSVMYKENEILAEMGDKAYYSESRMREVLNILFGDENIELKEPINVLTKTSGQYGLIFGDTEIGDAKNIENPWYYSIPNKLQIYVGVRQINQWAAGLEKREDYNIVNFVRYFNIPIDVFDNAPFLLDQKIYDQVRAELYGDS
mgnify:CR=1 FL=1